MSFISPLERLADKFNIISFNTRELISKLSAWSVSTEDEIKIMLKVEDSPYFETYNIPTLKFIKQNSIINSWNNNRPLGVKYWGVDMLTPKYLVSNKYKINLIPSQYPPKHFFEYNGNDVEGNLEINLSPAQFDGDILSFIVKISTKNLTKNVIHFNDTSTSTTILKLNGSHLVNIVENSPSISNIDSKIYKISFVFANKWMLFDLYEIPSCEYVDGSSTVKSSIFKDPFVQ